MDYEFRHDVSERVREAIYDIVRRVTWKQTAKNAITAGFLKSVLYSSSKVAKMLKSWR